jgi:uncharacterized OB-fold protein
MLTPAQKAYHRAYNHLKRLSGLCHQCGVIWLGPQWKCDACRARQNAANRARWASLTAEERAQFYRQRNSYRIAKRTAA